MVGTVNATTTGGGKQAFAERVSAQNQPSGQQNNSSNDAALMLALMGMGRQPILATTSNGAKTSDKAVAKATKGSDKVEAKASDDGESSGKDSNSQSGTCSGCGGAHSNPAWTDNSEAVEPAALENTTTSEAPVVELAAVEEPETEELTS